MSYYMHECTSNNRHFTIGRKIASTMGSQSGILAHRENPLFRTHVNALWLCALHSSVVVGLSTGFFTLCEKAVFIQIKAPGTVLRILPALQDQLRIIQTQSCSRHCLTPRPNCRRNQRK